MLLPLGIAVGLAVHLARLNRARLLPNRALSLALLGGMALAAIAVPAPLDPVKEAAKPVHMRGRATAKPHRAPVAVRVTIDGQTNERSFTAKGISHDGPAIDEWRMRLAEGEHHVTVEIAPGPGAPALRWSGPIRAVSRRLAIISYDPATGFIVE